MHIMKFVNKIKNWFVRRIIYREQKLDSINDLGITILGKLNYDIIPRISKSPGSKIIAEDGVSMISDPQTNPSGILHPCTFVTLSPKACIILGKDSGMSGVTMCCKKKITIGEYVGLGANVSIFDYDFHAINPYYRKYQNEEYTKSDEVEIGDFVWIGANSIILKGVHIGRGAVVGAGSVVTADIPDLCVYAGNPAKFIKKVDISQEQYDIIFKSDTKK